jgi:GT2 family glycosyltransferase
MNQGKFSAVIIHFNTVEYTRNLISMLREHCSASLEDIIVVDNASTRALVIDDDIPGLQILRFDENRGYAAACNAGAEHSSSPYCAVLNSDLKIHNDVFLKMISVMENDESIGIIGPKLVFPDGRFQLSYGEEPSLINEYRERKRQKESAAGEGPMYRQREQEAMTPQSVDWVTGACMLIRRTAFESIAGFDEEYFFYFEDSDLCSRMRRAGFTVRYDPAETVIHYGGGSQSGFSPDLTLSYRRGQLRYYARFRSRISFYLLKIYLCGVVAIRLISNKPQRAFYRHAFRLIFAFEHGSIRTQE